jgi:succinyl-CoA synthetase beta subunit
MNFEEYAAKPLLAKAGIAVPDSELAWEGETAWRIAERIGKCVVKAQVPTGKRGKAGGIKLASTPDEAKAHTESIIGMEIDGHLVEKVLIEAQVPFTKELYVAVLNDTASKNPMVLFSSMGGMNVEEVAEQDPDAMRKIPVDISRGLNFDAALSALKGCALDGLEKDVAEVLVRLYQAYRDYDAELLEINPLVLTQDNRVVALDCKLTVDDSAASRQAEIIGQAAPEKMTALEAKAHDAGLKYIDLGGSVGVLANGAGLTMTTMDAVTYYGGTPANFLEIGGEAYTKSRIALTILLENTDIRSLLVNFCGAFARTDVMTEGLVSAWRELAPSIPIFFTIHGTGEDEAVKIVRDQLGLEPFDFMDDAVKAAVNAAAEAA